MTIPINPPSSGAVHDAVHILLEGMDLDRETTMRAGAAVQQMLTLYWSEEWPEYMARRPDHIDEDLWERWGLKDEVASLRRALAETHARIRVLQRQRDDARARETVTDADIAAFVRLVAKEIAGLEESRNLLQREKFALTAELRQVIEDRDRFMHLATERKENAP